MVLVLTDLNWGTSNNACHKRVAFCFNTISSMACRGYVDGKRYQYGSRDPLYYKLKGLFGIGNKNGYCNSFVKLSYDSVKILPFRDKFTALYELLHAIKRMQAGSCLTVVGPVERRV